MCSLRPWPFAFRPSSRRYASRLLELPAMKDWYAAAPRETWRDHEQEVEARATGEWREDLRAG